MEKAIKAAKINGKKDPDRKAKELFVRLFKNDLFRRQFEKWADEKVPEIKKFPFYNENAFLEWAKSQGYMPIPDEILSLETRKFEFLGTAVWQFALFGKIHKWPVFGCRLDKLGLMEDYAEAAIVVHPEAALNDVLRYVEVNWEMISAVGKHNIPEGDKLGKVVPTSMHSLDAAIYQISQEHPKYTDRQIAWELADKGLKISSKDKPAYIRQALKRERERRKSKPVPESKDWL